MNDQPSYTTRDTQIDLDLAELIKRTQSGDQDAFGILFDRYKNLVYRTAYLMLNETEDADEALQEVFLKVHRSLSSYQPAKGAFTTWLYRITTNDCLNRLRRKRGHVVSLDWGREGDNRASFSQASSLEEDQAVQMALGRLSDKLRAVIVLRYYGNLSYAEIAESLGIPVGTVQSRLDLGLRTMRRELEAVSPEWNSK